MNVGGFKRFNWLPMQPAWKDMEIRRARRAEMLKREQANMDAINSAMADAQQNRITQSSNLFAKAALKRVQAAAKAKTDQVVKQIDAAQKLVDNTTPADKPDTTKSSTSSVLDTVA